ncbi:bifunctional alpha,alpha-trehalose-phosphate synthase (UDP-forming)/trehalose-phosphatase [Moheibacter sediminis]|uniref:Alpha,alpha-trehalose-phosphate synthase n=1 Tax=Moheibacter sediminis TaxID=1434700 RepID=A0A1W1YA15_9FLAO|nr:bifunctional alpha,alpha-trehalose-phosphate synthase (UDP-forming)/trehalose-phosphatase [Moheibacter sediminis]SMC32598.1 trehalose 6-phosphate synthase /trehalose 6-phosphatase [Moheibacter sediminis]
MKNKTIIVSNRLPLNVSVEQGDVKVFPSVGGLATGMKSIHQNSESLWIGWAGVASDEIDEITAEKIKKLSIKEKCVPVPLTHQELEEYYFGFSNRVLWPLFHYFMEYADYDETHWEAYKKVNEKFAEIILENLNEGDKIWVHDYQLLLLPQMIKDKRPDISVGFFQHIPFPSYEIFRTVPWREEILKGMLGADLLGFHTYDYERHFISSVSRILRYETNINSIHVGSRTVKVDSFPMSIDYEKFHNAAIEHQLKNEKTSLQIRIDQYKELVPDSKLILSIDRLDYTKGIAQRLKALEYFLDKYPQFTEKVRLIMLAVPSREEVPQYQHLKKEIDELVGRINGKFSTPTWTPVWYFYRSLPFEELIELYTSSDVAFLTPIRDGMNLVAKEYIASRTDQTGVLILSEMAGVAHEMNDALLINPNDDKQMSEALKQALEMPLEEQISRNKIIQKRIKRYNVDKWAEDFMEALDAASQLKEENLTRFLGANNLEKIIEKFNQSETKIFFLDYDGTLTGFHANPEKALPDEGIYHILNELIQKNVKVVIISGRGRFFLEEQFGHLPVDLVAEHGVWIRRKNPEWRMSQNLDTHWMESIRPIIENFVDRTPGSFLEEKEFSLVWHYRKVAPGLSEKRANELNNVLTGLLANSNIGVMPGNKVLEVKNAIVNKGSAANSFLSKPYDFIFGMGDDWTDEYIFRELPESAITVKVGTEETAAKYYIENQEKVKDLLRKFIL